MGKKIKFLGAGIFFAFAVSVLGMFFLGGTPVVKAASSKTGTGLAEHALKAYGENWKYSYGSYGQLRSGSRYSDCSGLIKSYFWWTGDDSNPDSKLASVPSSSGAMLSSASESGTITSLSSIPRVHGLILYSPGHVGVYVGDNLEVDNRCSGQNIKCENVVGGSYHWKKWIKLPQLSYPTDGFVKFNGHTYYYENGEYIVGTTRTIDGKCYTFDKSGVMTDGIVNAGNYADASPCSTLQKGSRGSDVMKLQKDLIKLGCMSCSPTGYYGDITQSAVAEFQKKADLSVTGIANEKTLKAVANSF